MAQAEIEAKDQQIVLLENESRSWQERNAQFLTKVNLCSASYVRFSSRRLQYDRIDPTEFQSVKDELAKLQTEAQELQAAANKEKEAHLQKVCSRFPLSYRRDLTLG